MSPPDLTRPLAQLLSDSRLRHDFSRDPATVVDRLALPPASIAALQEIDTGLLERQARSLLGKRRFKVTQILPRTWQHLGDDATDLFKEYALEAPWPTGHRRHLLDAAAFCSFWGYEPIRLNRPVSGSRPVAGGLFWLVSMVVGDVDFWCYSVEEKASGVGWFPPVVVTRAPSTDIT